MSGRYEYEIIFVDDGSTDSSFAILTELAETDPRVKIIRLRRNFGQTAAMSAGFDYAKGGIICPCDGDRQNDPADIPLLIAKLDEGYDIVSGWRKKRHDKACHRRLPSMIANKLNRDYHRRKAPRFRLHTQGLSPRSLAGNAPLRRNAPFHTCPCRMVGRSSRRTCRQSSASHSRRRQIWTRQNIQSRPRPYHGKIPRLVFDKTDLHFRRRRRHMRTGAVISGLLVLYQKFISESHLSMNRNPLLILDGDIDYHKRSVHFDGASGRDYGSHLPRIAEPPDVCNKGNHRFDT